MSQPEAGAVELPTVESTAQELERRAIESEQPEETDGIEEKITNEESTESSEEEEVLDSEEETEIEEESETDEPESNEESTDYETLNDLAEALEMPIETFMDEIKGRVKVNGEEYDVTLSEAMKGYQMEADYRHKTTELATQRKTFEQERTQELEKVQSALTEVNVLLTNQEQALQQEYNQVDWDELKNTDREEYLVRESEFNRRNQALQAQRQTAQQQAYQVMQQQQTEHQTHLRDLINKEYGALMASIPEWDNEDTRTKEQAEISTYLLGRGFDSTEINLQQDEYGNITHPGVIDHRMIGVVRDAMKYRAQENEVEIAKKRVKKLPKMVRSGNKQSSKEVRALKKDGAKQKFMKSGSTEDLIATLLENSN